MQLQNETATDIGNAIGNVLPGITTADGEASGTPTPQTESANTPNAETEAALAEAASITTPRFDSTEQLIGSLESSTAEAQGRGQTPTVVVADEAAEQKPAEQAADAKKGKGQGKHNKPKHAKPQAQTKPEGETSEQRPQRPPQTVFAEGFVKVISAKGSVVGDDAVRFVGLIVEGKSRAGFLRNRFIVPDKRCPDWFKTLCSNIANGHTNMKVRVKVTRLFQDHLCFAIPAAASEDQAKGEWGRRLIQESQRPKRLEDCKDDTEIAELVYRHACMIARLEFISFVADQSGGNDHVAYAVDDRSNIIRISRINYLLDFVEGIKKGATTLEYEIEANLRYEEVRD